MRTSDSIKAIAPALVSAQKAITFASKDGINPHFKNKYASLSSVIDAVKPALNEAGIVFIQTASPSEDNKLHLTTRLIHSSLPTFQYVSTEVGTTEFHSIYNFNCPTC